MKLTDTPLTSDTPLTFQGVELGEQYRPISHIIQHCEFFMNSPHAGRGFLGGFMTAVIDNNFMQACTRADNDNGQHLKLIATFMYMYGGCVIEKHK